MINLNRRQLIAGGMIGLASFQCLEREASASEQSDTMSRSCLTIEAFPVPAGEHPHDVAPALDDPRIWYTAQHAGSLGLLDPSSGAIESIPLGGGSSPHGVIVGPGGDAWVTDSGLNAIVRVDAVSHELAIFPLPGPNANLNTAVINADGVVWFTGQAGVVGRVDPSRHRSGDLAEIIDAPRGVGPYGITVAPDGTVYFASLAGSYLGRIDVNGDTFTVTVIEPPTSGQGTRRAWSDSQGAIWSSQWNAGQLANYDPATEFWREWQLPGDSPQPYAVYVDDVDDVWLSDFGSNALVRFDPDSERFEAYPLDDPNSAVRQILGRPGEIWGAASGVDKLVVLRCA